MRYEYIPDITERFPEGFGGVDMTPSFYGEPVDWSRAYGYEPTYEELDEIPFPAKRIEKKFEVGQEYRMDSIFGFGFTTYRVKSISDDRKEIVFTDEWFDVDGNGKREDKVAEIITDENGYERALDWKSEEYGEFWIYAYKREVE